MQFKAVAAERADGRPGGRGNPNKDFIALDPRYSAAAPMPHSQRYALLSIALGFAIVLVCAGLGGSPAAQMGLALPFAAVIGLRLAAIWYLARDNPPARCACASTPAAGEVPFYSVLIPLRNERAIAAGLVHAMSALRYPLDRLEILFLTELEDEGTRTALQRASLTPAMQILTVPPGHPKTKPRALNYGLGQSRGDLIVIYDAEDVPDPDQLLKAAAMFGEGGSTLACVQARLAIDNAHESAFTRQFALEYMALFDALLPAIRKLGFPIPLGGTSNHFRRSALLEAGGWDSYNVTEDADLGMRLARLNMHVEMLDSVTKEDAPVSAGPWFRQRMRWLKGWMQTYLVHMRDPGLLWRNLGAWRFVGFQIVFAGMLASALTHLPAVFLLSCHVLSNGFDFGWNKALSVLCLAVMVSGYAAAMTLTGMAALRDGQHRLFASIAFLPLYWLAISLAAYAALWELYRRPFYWQKTEHAARPETLLRPAA